MDITLDRIDELRARADVSYEEACNYLRATDGDVVEALLMVERARGRGDRSYENELIDRGRDMFERLRRAVEQSGRKKLVVRQEHRTVAELPLVAGVVGAILAPKLAVISAVAALVTKSTVDIEDSSGISDA
jgi:hypothetical protein